MTDSSTSTLTVEEFVEQWQPEDQGMKNCFLELYRSVAGCERTTLQFVARPGVSYSLRPRHDRQTDRELFAIIDVIDDNPDERWLSVCFYGDMITDPEERGEVIPGGLAGSDGYCFDLYAADGGFVAYLEKRLQEAWTSAGA
ncbi:MAG: hypothetical protein ACK5PS_06615 [Desulfopila sp.]